MNTQKETRLKMAVIMTCFNRKEKTLNCLSHLFSACKREHGRIDMSIYLTDDACTDGTAEAVKSEFPEVHILKGTGYLYWAGGMRLAWNEALQNEYAWYLLLNDDTLVHEDLFSEFFKIKEYCKNIYDTEGVFSGITSDLKGEKTTYGGSIFINKFLATTLRLNPTGKYQECTLANSNIMFVPNSVIKKIGIFDNHYVHGAADYDYSMMTRKCKIPLLLSQKYWGVCENDHHNVYENFTQKKLSERLKIIYNPVKLGFSDSLYFTKKFFIYRYPIVLIGFWLKLLFPRSYLLISDFRRKELSNIFSRLCFFTKL